jgi:hypothetical protein
VCGRSGGAGHTETGAVLGPATFKRRDKPSDPDPDEIFTLWRETGRGFYAPDLFIFGLPLDFRG